VTVRIVTSSVDGVQGPLLIVHLKIFCQVKPFTKVEGVVGELIFPEPLKMLQAPVPTVGLFPFSEAEVAHTVCPAPAFRNVMVPE